MTDNAIIQFKSGKSSTREIIDQAQTTEGVLNRPVVVFGPALPKSTIQQAGTRGVVITNDIDELVGVIKD